MHSYVERIGENIGTENSGARAAMAGKRESFDYGSSGDTHSQGWPGDLY
jgi:hypothetical protein